MATRKGKKIWRRRLLGALLIVLAMGAAWQWWLFIHWTPERQAYPVQGVLIGERDGDVNFVGLRAIGADFVYLEASRGADGRDARFARNMALAQASGIRFGVVHHYDPCQPAERQAANFVTIVPRDEDMLPPAVELDDVADDCSPRVGEAEVESELTTFLNQVEGHVGKPALLRISSGFEKRYRLAARVERNLWLDSNRFQPDYAGRPWMLWTANSMLRTEAKDGPLRWVVVQP